VPKLVAKAGGASKPDASAKPAIKKEKSSGSRSKGKPAAKASKQPVKAPPAPPANPFEGWAGSLHLPPYRSASGGTEKQRVELAKLRGTREKSPRVELIGGDVVFGETGRFMLTHSGDKASQRAIVNYVGKTTGETPVAAFTLRSDPAVAGHSLGFAWEEEVRIPRVDRLRNCLLEVAVGDDRKIVPLRKTIQDDPIPVAGPGGGCVTDRSVDALPQPSLLRFEITELAGPQPYQRKYENVTVKMDGTGIIALQDGERPIKARLSVTRGTNKIEIESRVLFHTARSKRPDTFAARIGNRQLEGLRRSKQQLEFQFAAMKDANKDKRDRLAELSNQFNAQITPLNAQIAYLEKLLRLCEQQHSEVLAHFRMYATVEGHDVCLIKSN